MRKLKCFQVSGVTVEEVLDEFNERVDEFGITESDVVNVSVMQPTGMKKIHTPNGNRDALVEVVIVYWANP